ncbi:uncharacterized protein BYT42DRAFT_649328 [Radiomyces spectabilis]|uniref:uncharacterized protein n=1 Tax=Radiomyces spectabilis TaxID=64574 RepID=UPI00221F93BD|nr:uncharacterized protein BYT42DRAFT_649328 [Radiomyces spectabilis]KAI8364660.1 hypothetical protein BYT42DRAFT_649328 [Radiomyces spectabilis]
MTLLDSVNITHITPSNLSHNELWEIIQKQCQLIQELQQDTSQLTIQRDSLHVQVESLEQRLRYVRKRDTMVAAIQRIDGSVQTDSVPVTPCCQCQSVKWDRDELPGNTIMPNRPVRSSSPPLLQLLCTDNSEITCESLLNELARNSQENAENPTTPTSDEPENMFPLNDANLLAPMIPASLTNLANIAVNVVGCHLKRNAKGKEVISFTISVATKNPSRELWKIEKLYSDFLNLQAKIKSRGAQTSSHGSSRLPEKNLFSTKSSTKIGQRKTALERHLQQLVAVAFSDVTELCEFLSTDIVENKAHAPASLHKEGELTKRGKNFGAWKTRYFVLNGPVLDYYDSKHGNKIGSIRLTNAKIGRQASSRTNEGEDYSSVYRHAFLILEQKRPASSTMTRHILCANSDDERDAWVEILCQQLCLLQPDLHEENPENTKKALRSTKTSSYWPFSNVDDIALTVPAPTMHHSPTEATIQDIISESSSECQLSIDSQSAHTRYSSAEQNSVDQNTEGQPKVMAAPPPDIHVSGADELFESASEPNMDSSIRLKLRGSRRLFWSKKSHSMTAADDLQTQAPPLSTFRYLVGRASNESSNLLPEKNVEVVITNPVFGVELEQAVRVCCISKTNPLPAVVYRCIEYLNAKNAMMEEGLYRLSGSAAWIHNMRLKFDEVGDVDLLSTNEDHDIHAVAGLLKLWLRELPDSVFTAELRQEFLLVVDLINRNERIQELQRLMSCLPLPNYTLLRSLAAHLIQVVHHSEVNKMTMRNISIIFAPTLGIPLIIFHLFMNHFEHIFFTESDSRPSSVVSEVVSSTSTDPVHASDLQCIKSVSDDCSTHHRQSLASSEPEPTTIMDLERNLDDSLGLMFEALPFSDVDEDEVDELALAAGPQEE